MRRGQHTLRFCAAASHRAVWSKPLRTTVIISRINPRSKVVPNGSFGLLTPSLLPVSPSLSTQNKMVYALLCGRRLQYARRRRGLFFACKVSASTPRLSGLCHVLFVYARRRRGIFLRVLSVCVYAASLRHVLFVCFSSTPGAGMGFLCVCKESVCV